MTPAAVVALTSIALVAVASTVIGSFGVRFARNTSDFLVASRTVGPTANAGAISGEYLSAASFLSVAGMIMKDGPDALWYPVGYTGGYLALLLFVSAPLRRSGAYTVPDFAEFRLRSPLVQRVSTIFVIVIGWMYLLPQLQGAGLTVATAVPTLPPWTGAVAAGLVVIATVVFGGMRSITFVQAFQFWLKLTALALPALILVIYLGSDHRPFNRPAPPQFPTDTTVQIKTDVVLQVSQPVTFEATGVLDGQPVRGLVRWNTGEHTVLKNSRLTFDAGSSVPVPAGSPARDSSWLTPLSGNEEHPLVGIYSLIMACFLGTMGLPHVLVRFYTNPDGRATRRTAVAVLAMLGGFYLFPTLLGAMSRLYVPQLLVSGDTDAAVLLLPSAALGGGPLPTLIGGLVAAGAWAAFLSTASGLVVGVAGVLSTSPTLFRRGGVRDFRLAAVLAGVVPLGLALFATRMDFAQTVALAFAVAASTFCPLLVLGIWWSGLTDRGAVAGLLVGGVTSAGAVMVSLIGFNFAGWLGTLLGRPAIITVPLAFLVMIVVSKATSGRLLPDVSRLMLRLHAPERLGLSQDRARDLDEATPDLRKAE
ncbi:cation acetate symporter [Pseudonocardia acaciae]|uniref:sodium/solute symporter n=1 Tax=Pseudonocardia acaciae TaxID=551276 RepID=UPI00055E02F8|nr:cation acetate symporter [Pseudonocardia acaciae]